MELKLFEPQDDKTLMTVQHKELGRMKEFSSLKHHEQRFVWAYSCMTSRFVEENKTDLHARAKKAFEWAYKSFDYSSKQHQEFCSLVFPEHMKAAIDRMAKFDPSRRGRAMQALENEYESLLQILESPIPGKIGIEIKDEDTGEMVIVYEEITPAQIKQVIEAKEKAREALPQVLNQLEEGFGISVAKSDIAGDESDADIFIREQELNSNN